MAAGRALQFGLFGRQQGLGAREGQAKALTAGRVHALWLGQVTLWRCEIRPHQDHLDRTQEKHAHSDGRTRVSPRLSQVYLEPVLAVASVRSQVGEGAPVHRGQSSFRWIAVLTGFSNLIPCCNSSFSMSAEAHQ